mgnify:CR=1 FL=1
MYTMYVHNVYKLWYCVHMRTVTIRDFRKNMKKELLNTPFQLTRDNIVIAEIRGMNDDEVEIVTEG